MGDQSVMVYVDEPVIVGENGLYADLTKTVGRINVFNTEYSRSSIKGFILAK